MGTSEISTGFTTWAIVATNNGYEARLLPMEQMGRPNVVAIHPSERSAESGLKRVDILTGIVLPKPKSLRLRAELQNSFRRAIRDSALPNPQADDPRMKA